MNHSYNTAVQIHIQSTMHAPTTPCSPGTSLGLLVQLQYLLHLVNATIDRVVQDTRYQQALHLLSVNIELL